VLPVAEAIASADDLVEDALVLVAHVLKVPSPPSGR
jgi:hypothetical protein